MASINKYILQFDPSLDWDQETINKNTDAFAKFLMGPKVVCRLPPGITVVMVAIDRSMYVTPPVKEPAVADKS